MDLKPEATTWLVKDGVLLEKREFKFKVPGVIGVVGADDLATDLRGGQFLENKQFDTLMKWAKECVENLLTDAIKRPYTLQPDAKLCAYEVECVIPSTKISPYVKNLPFVLIPMLILGIFLEKLFPSLLISDSKTFWFICFLFMGIMARDGLALKKASKPLRKDQVEKLFNMLKSYH